MNLQRKDDLEKLHEQGCHDMTENQLCASESSTHIIRVSFPATQPKPHFSLQSPIMSPFLMTGNIPTETNGAVVVPLALRACLRIQAYLPGSTCQAFT